MPLNASPAPGREPEPPSSIVATLATGRRAVVALSGGVDSSVVAFLAHEALGPGAVAVTLTGPAVSTDELESATRAAKAIGIEHVVLTSNPLTDARYADNPTNRCYFCRNHEGDLIRSWGKEHNIETLLDGIQLDDLGDDRPGIRAMDEHGFQHPLVEARWSKATVRAFARATGLPTWDRPSNACLASRIVHGEVITAAMLDRIARAEAWLSDRGYRRVRVRVSGERARVEVGPGEIPRLMAESELGPLRTALTGLGFASVEVDPDGYRPRSNA